jgi:hypothetical protein
MPLLSRRKLIATGAAAGAAAIIAPIVSKMKFGDSIVEAATLSVDNLLTVASVSSPSSIARLNQLFPGLLSDPGFQQLLPVAFLVSNIANRGIRAFSSRWTVSTPSAVRETTIYHYFHPRGGYKAQMHWGTTGNKTRFTGKIPVIEAGTTRLLTPFFNWSPSYYSKNSNPDWAALLQQRARPEFPTPELASVGASVSISIDAAVTHDFTAVGPRANDLAKIIRVTRNAEHDAAVSALRCISTGVSPEEVKTHLRHEASGLAFDIRPESDLYYRVRQRQAKVLLRRLKYARWEQFLKTLDYLKKKPKTTTSIISLV